MLSIIIPVYSEQEYLIKTLKNLALQNHIHGCEIILAEYNPDNTLYTTILAKQFYDNYKIPILVKRVEEKGIAKARNEGFLESEGDYILNFDADGRFNRKDALDKMTLPLMSGDAEMTICDNEFDYVGMIKTDMNDMAIPQQILDGINNTQIMGFPVLEPGSCFTRESFIEVGGFNDVTRWELMRMGPRFILRYPGKIKHVPGVSVIVSPRRALKLKELGIGTLNYENAIRGDQIMGIK